MEVTENEARFRSEGVGVKQGEMGFGLGLEEIHDLISVPSENEINSFTALLELSPPQAVELLVKEDFNKQPIPPPFFPSNASLIDHAAKFSVFASTDISLECTTMLSDLGGSMKAEMVKQEPLDSNSWPNSSSSPAVSNHGMNPTKRKHREKQAKESNKKNKRPGESQGNEGSDEKLPYVHVRARRGQATDSHSLAERARREKINARMKLLQELVPGCNKISGTALVLDEIINHVQALQRQVEFLSMKLAAVDPRVDFNLDCLLAAEAGTSTDNSNSGLFAPPIWPDNQMNFIRQHHHQYQQPLQFHVQHEPSWGRQEVATANFLATENSLPSYDSPSNSASRHSSHFKMEL